MKTSWLMASAALALAFSSSATSAAAQNLVQNGSFEGADGLAGWTIGGSALDGYLPVAIAYNQVPGRPYPFGAQNETVPTDNVTTSLSPDSAGDKGVYFVTDNALNLSLFQVIHLDAGSYDVGFDSYDTFNGAVQPADARLTAEILGTSVADFALSSVSPGVWSYHSGVAKISRPGNYSVSFAFSTPDAPTNAKDVILDRVFVVADANGGGVPIPGVPEPETWVLMLLGIGAAGAILRQRAAPAKRSESA